MTDEPCPTARMLAQWRAARDTEHRAREARDAIQPRPPTPDELRKPNNTRRRVTRLDMIRVAELTRGGK